jgi:hypothetical protein
MFGGCQPGGTAGRGSLSQIPAPTSHQVPINETGHPASAEIQGTRCAAGQPDQPPVNESPRGAGMPPPRQLARQGRPLAGAQSANLIASTAFDPS